MLSSLEEHYSQLLGLTDDGSVASVDLDPSGLKVSIYSNLASPAVYTPESDAVSPLLAITPATLVINSIVSDNAIGGKNTLEFHYQGYKTHREDGAVGYHKIEKRNLTSGLTTLTEYSTDELLKGTPVRVTQHSNGQLISETASTHEEITDPLTGRERARVSYSVEHDYALDGNLIKTEETHYHAYNAFDQLLRLETVTRGADGIEYRQLTESSYLNDEAEWVLAKPLIIEATHSVPGDTKKRATAFSYYPNGALRTETIQPGHPLALESTFSYNTEGNLTQPLIITECW